MQREKATDGGSDLNEVSQVGGLAEVQVGSEICGGLAVGWRVRRAEHEDRNVITAGDAAHVGQHLAASLARQIQIEDEKRRTFGEKAVMNVVEKLDGLLAVGEDAEFICDVVLQECFAHQDHVTVVIFDEKNRTGAQSLAVRVFVRQ